ncbi:BTAD domain-containing putative transcriptional regulator [Nakamurella endophytica]|uniref:OmpR/PhoB-type domain-containing protein n=1 Tax=Nakamurella endophytica TaxID=1748367 RepID=A0A917SN30_9ACTN|nr:BTAD domain-containing putative transcriptional regulator [Nakamurella endophytica]GGL90677.1 hypothetical protein GCM10011594_07880 [Nakamurella endophytica]
MPAAALDFGVLGAVRALRDGQPLDLGGPRQRSVVARLLIAEGRAVSAEVLVADLWRSDLQPRAIALLQAHISLLRRVLEPDRAPRSPAIVLVTEPPGYALRAGGAVDAADMAALTADGDRLLPADPAAAADRYAAAEALWRGPAYADFADEAWAATERIRLEDLRLALVERRATAELAAGRTPDAVTALRAHVTAHPLREEAWRLLALGLYRSGRQGDALGALREARARLSEDLGVDPGPELRRLEQDILAHADHLVLRTAAAPGPAGAPGSGSGSSPASAAGPASSPSPASSSRPTGSTPDGPSDAALSSLVDTARPARGGGAPHRPTPGAEPTAPATDPGDPAAAAYPAVGATAVGEATPAMVRGIAPATGDGTAPAAGQAFGRSDGLVPQVPVTPLIGRAAEVAELSSAADRARRVGLQVAVVAGEAGGGKTALLDHLAGRLRSDGWRVCAVRCPETDGAPSGWPWIDALRRLAADLPDRLGPDAATLAPWLTDVAGDGDAVGSRFRVHRAVADWLGTVAGDRPLLVTVDDLHRADDETAAMTVDLVETLSSARVLVVAGHRPEPSPGLTRTLAALARRSPARLELAGLRPDAVDALVDEWALVGIDATTRAVIADRSGGNPFYVRELVRLIASGQDVAAVPGGVRDVVRQRLAVLPAETVTLLRVAAVGGREIDTDVLLTAAAAGGTAPDLDDGAVDALELALVSGLLVEPAPGRVGFGHALVRDTLYDDLSSVRRARWHGRIASALEVLRPDDVTALAHHHESAGPSHAAATARYAAAAADLAEHRWAYTDAADWWARAESARRTAGPDDVAGVLRLRARQIRAAQLAGDVARSRSLREDILPVAAATGDHELTAEIILAADVPTIWSPRSVHPQDHYLLGLTRATADRLAGRPDLRARLLAVVATELEGDPDDAGYRAGLEALEVARAHGDPTVLAHALYGRYLHTYRDLVDGIEERRAVGAELLDLARRHGLGQFEAAAQLILLQACCARADWAAADVHAADAVTLAERYGLPLLAGIGLWYRGLRLALAGRWAEAEAAYDTASAAVSTTGFYRQSAELTWWVSVFCLRLSAGRYAELLDMTRSVLDATSPDLSAETVELLAVALLVDGRPEEARELLDRSGPPSPVRDDYFGPVRWALRAMVGLGLDDRARVDASYAALLPHRDTVCGAWTASVAVGPTATLLARLAAHRGDAAAAAEHQQVAVRVAGSTGNADWLRAARAALDGPLFEAPRDVPVGGH